MTRPLAWFGLVCALAAAASSRADAGEIAVAAGLDARASSGENDAVASGSVRFEYRFHPLVGMYGEGRLGYGTVDERVLQAIDLGAQLRRSFGRVAPRLRLGLVHQHENPADAIGDAPVSTLGGWGHGIRHRQGVSAGTGVDVRLADHLRGELYLALDLAAAGFVDSDDGPRWYLGGGAGIGLSWR